jgi:hypothetical protein
MAKQILSQYRTQQTLKNILFLSLWIFLYFFTACANQKAKVTVENNRPSFANSRQFEADLNQLKRSAKQTLENLQKQSNPASDFTVKDENNEISTAWIYSRSKDKSVQTTFNSKPKRIELTVRRKYILSLSTTLGGSQVVAVIKEEIQDLDAKTGQAKSWRSVTADSQAYADLMQSIQENLRSL